eukprot:scaffold34434_cov31-Attheya_sp.AAC.1
MKGTTKFFFAEQPVLAYLDWKMKSRVKADLVDVVGLIFYIDLIYHHTIMCVSAVSANLRDCSGDVTKSVTSKLRK